MYTTEELEKKDLVLKYIDFQSICEDYDLDEGGLSPEQMITLEQILIKFIQQNKWDNNEE